MKNFFQFIEPLEARVAPAVVTFQAGGPGQSLGEIDYTDTDSVAEDAVFINTEANPNDPISAIVGPGIVGVADTFYVKMTTSMVLKVFSNTGFQPLISGNIQGNAGITGTLIAFFVDRNLDNEVQGDELTGLALGRNVSAIVSGNVDGDIVSLYNDSLGKLGGASEPAGQARDLLKNSITNLVISGDVNGSVLSGGQINRLRIGGSVEQVLTGTAANGYAYDFNGALADGGDTLAVNTPAPRVAGISILNTTVGELDILRAGDGGAGAKGGSLSGITVLADENGFLLAAGNGGAGVAASVAGGAGGTVSGVVVNGLDAGDVDETPNALVQVLGGTGGAGFGAGGVGGAGGAVQTISIGFEAVPGLPGLQRSVTPLNDEVVVQAGSGGSGKIGGAGGTLRTVSIFAAPAGAGNDIIVAAGAGGATSVASTAARSGVGGSITGLTVLNPGAELAAESSRILVDAGDGGSAAVGGSGGNGGNITTANLTGFQVEVRAGDGADGQRVGGIGGGLTGITLAASSDGVRAERVIVNAGAGGDGTLGRGGRGGAINGLTMVDVDLLSLSINGAGAGDGGDSQVGAGAAGGSVSRVDITEFDTGNAGTILLRAGNGGNGGNGSAAGGAGGAGGSVITAKITGVQLDLAANGGAGGDATLTGAGGRGGAVTGVSFFSHKQDGGTEVTATLAGGAGGDGLARGAGGSGGDIRSANIRLGQAQRVLVGGTPTALVDGGELRLTGGAGGSAQAGAAGAGGAVLASSVLTYAGAVFVTGANAGTGSLPGSGGRVDNVAIEAGTDVTVVSGTGGGGGSGGTINNIGFVRAEERLNLTGTISADAGSAPIGSITVVAGAGSASGRAAGNGGTVSDVSGFVGLSGTTALIAGNGAATSTRAGNGGNISNINLFGGGAAGVEIQIRAGDATASAGAARGGNGGSILAVGVGVNPYNDANPADPDNAFALAPGTILRSIVAGNGGDTGLANGKGGKGGDVRNFNTHHDIGVRSGVGFGVESMGGIFAGAGGINTTVFHSASTLSPKDGAAGSVLQVTADAIAAITAGRLGNGDVVTVRNLVTRVDDIILNGLNNPTVVDANGTYLNFDTANLIGGVVNPDEVGAPYPAAHPHANTFDAEAGEFIDNDGSSTFGIGDTVTAQTDGFIAAISFINNLANVRPEALLTLSGGFIDLNNTNGQAVSA